MCMYMYLYVSWMDDETTYISISNTNISIYPYHDDTISIDL